MTHADFLERILAEPDDDTPRLVFADWLEEQGEAARAEFIRVQCELASLEPLVRSWPATRKGEREAQRFCDKVNALRLRADKLLAADEFHWLLTAFPKDLPWGPWGLSWRRGFVEVVSLPAADWLAHGPALVRAAPLREVRLTDNLDGIEGSLHGDGVISLRWWGGERRFGGVDYGCIGGTIEGVIRACWPAIHFEFPATTRPLASTSALASQS